MKVTVEFVIRDEEGKILSKNTPVSMDIGTQSPELSIWVDDFDIKFLYFIYLTGDFNAP